jgi:hypothetical protein
MREVLEDKVPCNVYTTVRFSGVYWIRLPTDLYRVLLLGVCFLDVSSHPTRLPFYHILPMSSLRFSFAVYYDTSNGEYSEHSKQSGSSIE